MISPNGEVQFLKDVICQCLYVGEQNMSAEEKYKSYKLCKLLIDSDEAELSAEDISLIKKVCSKCISGAGGFGQIVDLLEGK